jgi:hypothetical protein
MLRRHLRRGGAPVSACAGFDPDRASAYLEGGLGGKARGRYEAHLAGCPACRRHIIELSRLSQLALQAEAMPAVTSRRLQWRSSLAERIVHWGDPSSWWLNWRLTGTALAGCAILAFAMIARPWRQLSFTGSKVSITTARQDTNSSAAMQAPSPTPPVENVEYRVESKGSILASAGSNSGSNTGSIDAQSLPTAPAAAPSSAGNAQAGYPQTERVSALSRPKPVIPAPRIGGNLVIARNDRLLRDKQEHRPASEHEPASPPPTIARERARRAAVPEFIPLPRRATSDPGAEVVVERRNQSREEQSPSSLVIPRMTPNPEYNPMQSGLLREKGMPRVKNEKGSPQNQKTPILTHVVDYMKNYLPWPWRRTDGFERSLITGKDARKDSDTETDERQDSAVDKGEKPRRLRGKTFRYVRGVWIDDEYDAEMSAWRLTFLRRGSEEYNRVLAEQPQLKEFFDFGPIIIVWRDNIYRVQR